MLDWGIGEENPLERSGHRDGWGGCNRMVGSHKRVTGTRGEVTQTRWSSSVSLQFARPPPLIHPRRSRQRRRLIRTPRGRYARWGFSRGRRACAFQPADLSACSPVVADCAPTLSFYHSPSQNAYAYVIHCYKIKFSKNEIDFIIDVYFTAMCSVVLILSILSK